MAKKINLNLAKVEELASLGLTHEQIADSLGISQTTLYTRKKSEDFAGAIKKGQAKGIAHVTNKLREQIDDGNVTATIFFLKTQAKWKETQVIENNHGLQLKSLSELFTDRSGDGEKAAGSKIASVNSEGKI